MATSSPGYRVVMNTTPDEPLPEPDVKPSLDPEPVVDPGPEPEVPEDETDSSTPIAEGDVPEDL